MISGTGLFVVFDGGEGLGKSTALTTVTDRLRALGIEPLITREPGGTKLGARLRALILDPELPTDTTTEALMFAADRSDHVRSLVRPALAQGRIVLSDRYVSSTRAYQSLGDTPGEIIETLITIGSGELRPHRTYLFDGSPEVGLARAGRRGELSSFDARELSFHRRVREAFLGQARDRPEEFLIIDGEKPPEEAVRRIMADLDGLIRTHALQIRTKGA